MSKSQPCPLCPLCLVTMLSVAVMRYPDKSNLKEKGHIRECGSGWGSRQCLKQPVTSLGRKGHIREHGSGWGVEAVSEVAGHKQERKAANAYSCAQVASQFTVRLLCPRNDADNKMDPPVSINIEKPLQVRLAAHFSSDSRVCQRHHLTNSQLLSPA